MKRMILIALLPLSVNASGLYNPSLYSNPGLYGGQSYTKPYSSTYTPAPSLRGQTTYSFDLGNGNRMYQTPGVGTTYRYDLGNGTYMYQH